MNIREIKNKKGKKWCSGFDAGCTFMSEKYNELILSSFNINGKYLHGSKHIILTINIDKLSNYDLLRKVFGNKFVDLAYEKAEAEIRNRKSELR